MCLCETRAYNLETTALGDKKKHKETSRISQKGKVIQKDRAGKKMEKAIFGAGCFWGVEATFRHVPGVVSTTVGYSGGTKKDPSYEDVCSGTTGHTEAVEVVYDPSRVTYETLLDVFFANHDPSTRDRQGPDIGYQYRSVVFYTSPEQKALALAAKEKVEKSRKFANRVVTAVEPAREFYKAEEYHQKYLEKKGLKVCH